MLPRVHRLTRSEDFRSVVRSGARAGARTLVVHLRASAPGPGPIVGFVVSKSVGDSVTRHRVSRRLRHLVAERLDALPAGSAVVVRALPAAAAARSAELGADLDRCLSRVLDRPSDPAVPSVPSASGAGAGGVSIT